MFSDYLEVSEMVAEMETYIYIYINFGKLAGGELTVRMLVWKSEPILEPMFALKFLSRRVFFGSCTIEGRCHENTRNLFGGGLDPVRGGFRKPRRRTAFCGSFGQTAHMVEETQWIQANH